MLEYVTIDEAKSQIKVELEETEDYDAEITLKIQAASSAVQQYLGSPKRAWLPIYETDTDGELLFDSNEQPIPLTDSNGNFFYQTHTDGTKVIAPQVKQATLTLIGVFWRDRDSTNIVYTQNYLPDAVQALLFPLRRLAIA
jgi:hypothetical protein